MVGHGEARSWPRWIAAARADRHEIIKAAAQLRHGRVDGQQILGGDRSERNHNFGLDYSDLAHQEWRAGVTLVAFGRAVARGTALDHVRDVDFLARQSHRFDHVVEQLTGSAHKGFALRIFVGAGAFADEHQLGFRIAYPEDDLLAALLVQLASGAVTEILANEF